MKVEENNYKLCSCAFKRKISENKIKTEREKLVIFHMHVFMSFSIMRRSAE